MGQQLNKPNITLTNVLDYMAISENADSYIPPSNKEIRLAIDLAKQLNPLFEFNVQEHVDTIRRLCRYYVFTSKWNA